MTSRTAGFLALASVACCVAAPRDARAQHPNVRVSSLQVGDPEEVTITVDPTNPSRLAAGANISYRYYSFDGGLTWNEGYLYSTLGVAGDPVVLYDSQGNLYYAHLSYPGSGDWLDPIVVQESPDGGIHWTDGAGIGLNPPKNQDKPGLASDGTNSPYADNVYVAWTEFDQYGSSMHGDSTRILFSRSTNLGLGWSSPIKVSDAGGNCEDGDDTVEGAIPAVGPQGEVYLAWSGPAGIWFDRSLDGGVTFGADGFVTTQPGGWDFGVAGIHRCNGLPTTLCDISPSPYRGFIYVVWSDQRAGATDTDVFLARSTDGGQTFRSLAVSDVSFTPDPNVFFGDYIGVTAWNRTIHPIWMRMDGGVLSIWTARVTDEAFVDVGGPVASRALLLRGAFPNPFRLATRMSYALSRAGHVSVTIFDLHGRVVARPVNEPQGVGEHSVDWDGGDHPAGIYVYGISANGATASGKLILVR